MAVLGASPALTYVPTTSQAFSGNGSQTIFTLNASVSANADIEVLVDNVQQSPYDSSYTVGGTTLTFSEAPATGTNNIYVVYRTARIVATTQMIPDNGSVTSAKLSGALTTPGNLNVTGTIAVNTLQSLSNGQVTLTTGHRIKGIDVGSVVAPGMVIQTLYAKLTTVTDITSASFVDTGLSITITPKYANSIIYVTARLSTFWTNTTSASWGGGHRIVRDSTVIDDTMGDVNGPLDQWWNLPVTAATYKDFFMQSTKSTIDTPATTNTLVYKIQSAARASSSLKLNYGSPYAPHSLLIVQEIAQ